MAGVSLKNIGKTYPGGVCVVDNLNLEIEDKEFMVLVGPSGCGKSTTLRMIAGLEEITEGEISIADTVINTVPPKDRNIAMVFQNYALYPHKTVYANMAYGLKMRKFDKNKIEQLVNEAADILGITDYLDRKPKALSGGQRQRVAVGRAIVRKPEVFLFDEPLSNLDAKMRVQMRAEISKLHHQLKTTIIYVTHDQIEAMTMGTRICVMKDGYIQQVDAPLEIYNNPANKFVAGFIGSPPMNFFTGKLIFKDDSLFFDEGNFCVEVAKEHLEKLKSYAGKEITLGIRPGHMSVPENESVGTSVKSMIEVLEPMGDDVYVYLNTGKTPYVARLDDLYGMEVGKEFGLQFNMQRAFFFDIDTEITIV